MNHQYRKSFCLLSVVLLAACSDGGNGSGSASDLDPLQGKQTLSGSVVKGPIDGAILTLRPIDPNTGFVDRTEEPISETITDANGIFTIDITGLSGPGLLETSGGVFIDESDANFDGGDRRSVTLTGDQGLSVYIPTDVTRISVTLMTDAITRRAFSIAGESPENSLDNAFTAVRDLSTQALGYDPLTTTAVNPLNPGPASPVEKQYALLIGGLAYASHEVAIRAGFSQMSAEVIGSIIDDLSDGSLDGKSRGEDIILNGQPMADVDLASAISRFRSNNDAKYQGVTPNAPNEELLASEPTVAATPNSPPVAQADQANTNEDSSTIIAVLDNDSDPNEDALTIVGLTQPANGFSSIVDGEGTVKYTPNENFSGEDQFTYSVSDDRGGVSDPVTVTVTVLPVNDSPTAVDDEANTNEDQSVSIPVLANDSDAENDLLQVQAVSNPQNGSAFIDEGGNSVTYSPSPDFFGIDQFTYTITDGQDGEPSVATVVVFVASVNDDPVAQDDIATTPEDQSVSIAVLANDTDADGDQLSISDFSQAQNGAVFLGEGGNTLTYIPAADFFGEDQFVYQVIDGQEGQPSTATVTIAVTPVNDDPVAEDDEATTPEDQAVSIAVLDNDTDADGDRLSVNEFSQPENGTVFLAEDGVNFIYTPAENFFGQDLFIYEVIDDQQGQPSSAAVSITVTAVNDAPVAVDDQATTPEDQAITIEVVANDTDVDGDDLNVSFATQPENGSVSGGMSSYTYTPAANFVGDDTFTYRVTDGQGGESGFATVTVTVTSVNDDPVANPDEATTAEDEAVFIAVVDNDTDADGDQLSVNEFSQPANGTVSLGGEGGNTFTYTPNQDFFGEDQFFYDVIDTQEGQSSSATVTITVTSVNDAPVANPDSGTTPEDQAVTIAVLDNDTDVDGDTLSLVDVSPPANGSVQIDFETNTVTYTPNENFFGEDQFTYVVSDGTAQEPTPRKTGNGSQQAVAENGTSEGTVTITVTSVNDDPVAANDAATTQEDQPVFIAVLVNDTDADGDQLSIGEFSQAANGTVSLGEGDNTFTYTPNQDFFGEDQFVYDVTDGQGGQPSSATVTITVESVNDAPVANPDTASTDEDTSVSIPVLANDSDIDGGELIVLSVTAPLNGTAVINPDNTVLYSPNENYSGSDSFDYTVDDNQGGTAVATVSVTVNSINDAPVANPDAATTAEDQSAFIAVLENDTDAEDDLLSISEFSQAANGTVSLGRDGDDLIYTPNQNFFGEDSFTYRATDGLGGVSELATVTVTVTSVNDAPAAVDDTATTDEDTSVSIPVLANDSDPDTGDVLTVTSVTSAYNGTVVIDGGSSLTYTPNADFTGTDQFAYFIEDGQGESAFASVTISVTPVNDPPVAQSDSARTRPDEEAHVFVVENDTDVDEDRLTVVGFSVLPTNGTVSIDGYGSSVAYIPNSPFEFEGIDTFDYDVDDGQGGVASATVTIEVTSINAEPDAQPDSAITQPNVPVSVFVLDNDSDADHDPLIVTQVSEAQSGNAFVDGDGAFVTYIPFTDFQGSDMFTYDVGDGQGGVASATVNITVTSANTAPVAKPDASRSRPSQQAFVFVLDNDNDPDNDPLSVESISAPENGTATFDSGSLTYTPDDFFAGEDSLDYTVVDGQGGSAVAPVSLVVTSVNAQPKARPDAAITQPNQAVTVFVLDNDSDPENSPLLTVIDVLQPPNGSVTFDGDSVTYTPNTDFQGEDVFHYLMDDGEGGEADAPVFIFVEAPNSPPVANDDQANAFGEETTPVFVLENDTDPDADVLTVTDITQAPFGGTAVVDNNGGFVTYTASPGFSGEDMFEYLVQDGRGGSDFGLVTVFVDSGSPMECQPGDPTCGGQCEPGDPDPACSEPPPMECMPEDPACGG